MENVDSPRACKEVGKYQRKGMLAAGSSLGGLDLPRATRESLASIGNHGLSRSTWSNYRTAETMLRKCQGETGEDLELPLGTAQVLTFVDWLIHERGVKHRTIENYLAGIRQLHVVRGLSLPNLRAGVVGLVLTGKKNMETGRGKSGETEATRLPVTLNVMKLIKATVRKALWGKQGKLLMWAVCCLAFSGSFRVGELLAKEKEKFDPASTLLEEDVTVVSSSGGRKSVQVRVKWAKQDKAGQGFTVEVYETGSTICPVKALEKWWKTGPPRERGLPAFRETGGKAMTAKDFNKKLRELLGRHLDYKKGGITSHSFRGGVPSILGTLGYSDEEIKTVGHWSSRAFAHYTKLPRTRRRQMALDIKSF